MNYNFNTFLLTLLALAFSACSSKKEQSDFETELQGATWEVASFIDDGEDETLAFAGYEFTFEEEGSLLLTSSSQQIRGSWTTFTDDGKLELKINLQSPFLSEELDDEWYVSIFSESEILLTEEDETLRFVPFGSGEYVQTTRSVIGTEELLGNWQITNSFIENKNYTSQVQNCLLRFEANNSVLCICNNDTAAGSWVLQSNGNTVDLNFSEQYPDYISELSEDWKLLNKTDKTIQFFDSGEQYTNLLHLHMHNN